jgi:hypothetical protein
MRASALLLAFALAVNAAPRYLRTKDGLTVPDHKLTPFQEEKLQRKQARLAAMEQKMEQDRAKKDRKTPPAAAPAEGAAGQRRLAGTQDLMAAVFTAAHPSWTTCLTESGGTTADPCASSKITCDGNDVTEIWFPFSSLQGSIPKELGAITTLTRLWLYSNDLVGTVPVELGALTALTDFDLDYNDGLWGNLPLAFATQSWSYGDFQVSEGNHFNIAPCVGDETAGSTVAEEAGGVMCFLDAQRAGQTAPGSGVCADPANFDPEAMTTDWGGPAVCGTVAAEDFPTKPDCATLLRYDWEDELSPYGADCCGETVGNGACWHDVKNVCEVPANYLPMTKPANKFPVFDGTNTCDTMIISYTYYNEYASPGTADKAFMAEDWDEPGCPFSNDGASQRGAASETKKYFGACCSDGKTSCDGASSTVLAATAAVVAAVVALASI